MEIVILIIGLIIGCLLCYFVLRPKIKVTNKLDEDTQEQNNQITAANVVLKTQQQELLNQTQQLVTRKAELMADIDASKLRREELNKYLEEVDKSNEAIYKKSFDLMQEKLSQAAEEEARKFEESKALAQQEYLNVIADATESVNKALGLKYEELAAMEIKASDMRAKVDAAIAAAKREEEKLLEIDKYKILVTDLDLLEINRLREIAPYFRNARAIYKIIWESYYRNLTTEMVNRVVGPGTHTGIYKLTNLNNQKVYIGQAVDIGERFKQHTKCGLGIDTPSNMLYTAMTKDGVENFTFEVLEECERGMLNDREKYYIDLYRAQEHGYNMSRGGARN